MCWRCSWEPDECTPLSWGWSETILGYCSITCAPDSTNIGWIIFAKSSIKVWWRMWFNSKSLWILCKKIKFSTTSAFRIECFKKLQEAINILRIMKFPLIISVMGTHACYHHVVVISRRMIVDYESKYTFPLTNDSLRQICGVNTTFVGISCGYEIFPTNHIRSSMNNISIEDWGINEYNIKGSSIRKYFKW